MSGSAPPGYNPTSLLPAGGGDIVSVRGGGMIGGDRDFYKNGVSVLGYNLLKKQYALFLQDGTEVNGNTLDEVKAAAALTGSKLRKPDPEKKRSTSPDLRRGRTPLEHYHYYPGGPGGPSPPPSPPPGPSPPPSPPGPGPSPPPGTGGPGSGTGPRPPSPPPGPSPPPSPPGPKPLRGTSRPPKPPPFTKPKPDGSSNSEYKAWVKEKENSEKALREWEEWKPSLPADELKAALEAAKAKRDARVAAVAAARASTVVAPPPTKGGKTKKNLNNRRNSKKKY
jgi:hypothetical protein